MVWDIITKFSPVVKLYGNPLCTKYEGYRCTKIWISRQNLQKHKMGVAGSIFELHPPNFVRIHFFMSCKNAEIFVMISQLVPDLAKISVSETSISWDVLALRDHAARKDIRQNICSVLVESTSQSQKCSIAKFHFWEKNFHFWDQIILFRDLTDAKIERSEILAVKIEKKE